MRHHDCSVETISNAYDKNGNLTKKTEQDDDGKTVVSAYTYDFENRLIKAAVQKGAETTIVTFKYDPFGRRIEKKVTKTSSSLEGDVSSISSPLGGEDEGEGENKTYTYVYDREDIIAEYLTKTEDNQIKTTATHFVHGPGIDAPLAIEQKGEVYYYHTDGLGSITAITDAKQKIVESYLYDSFGNFKRKGDKVKNRYTFTGREWDNILHPIWTSEALTVYNAADGGGQPCKEGSGMPRPRCKLSYRGLKEGLWRRYAASTR